MPDWLTRNAGLKALALVLAFSLWAALTGQQPSLQDHTIPLSIAIDETQAFAAQPPSQVRVRLRGSQAQLRSVDPLGLVARISLRGRPPGRHDVQLGDSHVDGVPSRVEIELIEPDRVITLTDERRLRELAVEPVFRDGPPPGFHVYGARAVPERVTVEGPASAVDGLEHVETDPISLAGRQRPFSATVSAAPGSPMVAVAGGGEVAVRIVIDAEPVERSFDPLPVVVLGGTGDGDRVTIVPSAVRVGLAGPPQLLERLSPAQIRVGVDLAGVEPDGRSRRATVAADVLDLPQEQQQKLRVTGVRPGQVSVRVEPAPASSKDGGEPAVALAARGGPGS